MSPPNLKDRWNSGGHWVIAHRGYRTRYPENTLPAFEAALDAGVDMIELDVMLSRDRKMVVIHDPNLERTTNGKGSVDQYTLAELRELDAGGWFDPRFAGEPLPTLEEVLDLLGGQVLVNIEIKKSAFESPAPADAVENQVVDLVIGRGLRDSVLVSSFEWKCLERIAAMGSGPSLALLARYPGEEGLPDLCRRLEVFSFHPSWIDLKAEHVERFHQAGFPVFPYNVDTAEQYRQVMHMGVDGVITSDPFLPEEAEKEGLWGGNG
jgi:glycerophosphoryl diester phosphodiesterase